MNKNSMILAVVAVLVVASVSTGFALSYITTTTSRDNTIEYDGITLDVLGNDHLSLKTPIPVVGPTTELTEEQLTRISGGCDFTYDLKVNCPDKIWLQCWWNAGNVKNWAIIDSITLKITVNGVEHATDFMSHAPATSTSSIPSEALELSSGTYLFKVSILYRNIDLDLAGENQDFLNLSGSSVTFSASKEVPVPGVVNPWVTPVGP
ncbi:adhesin-like protein [methanogenic archaeon ISO4-H5]|nr:adhesin-like protein [methanogenic archaeon ISO4-H5]